MSKMNRRSFLQLLGIGATAAVIEPARLLKATELPGTLPRPDEVLVTRYSLLHDPGTVTRNVRMISGFQLPAPAGQRCRAELRVPENPDRVVSNVVGIQGFNEPGEVLLTHVADVRGIPHLMAQADATMLSSDACPLPVEWGVVGGDFFVAFEYESLSGEDETLWLALHHQALAPSDCPMPPFNFGGAKS